MADSSNSSSVKDIKDIRAIYDGLRSKAKGLWIDPSHYLFIKEIYGQFLSFYGIGIRDFRNRSQSDGTYEKKFVNFLFTLPFNQIMYETYLKNRWQDLWRHHIFSFLIAKGIALTIDIFTCACEDTECAGGRDGVADIKLNMKSRFLPRDGKVQDSWTSFAKLMWGEMKNVDFELSSKSGWRITSRGEIFNQEIFDQEIADDAKKKLVVYKEFQKKNLDKELPEKQD